MADLINTAAQFMRQWTKNGILLRKQWWGEVRPLLNTLEGQEGESAMKDFTMYSGAQKAINIVYDNQYNQSKKYV